MKKVISRLILWLLVLAAAAALVFFVIIPLFSETEEVNIAKPDIIYYEGEAEPLVMENDALLFELDPTTTQFKVTDKASGAEWLSNPADAADDSVALAANKENLQATVLVTYATSGGAVEMNNYKYSVENGNYTIEQLEDGSIKVNYAIGKIEKVYLIPTAITKERFVSFTDQMKKSTKKKLSSNYTLYEPEKLDSKKNKDEIIAMYPEVVNQPLYILKSDVKENGKKKIEEYFAEVNYSQEDFELDQQLVAGSKESSNPVFNIKMIYRLEGNDLVVELPYSEIRYMPDYPITYVTPLPMFGAAGLEDEGFMFVPEGGGALINFNNGKLAQNTYYANTYGWDYATIRKEVITETRNTFPVFGVSKNDASFICVMEGGSAYGGVQADISMRYNSYNWICAKYNVLHSDQYNVSAKTASLVYMYEKQIPTDTIVHRYRFVDSGSYVDMATSYGEYLRSNPLMADDTSSEEVPVTVEVVGAIDKTVVKFGLPIDSVVPVTTFAETEEMIGQLKEGGIKNLNVRFSGWANGGVTQKVFRNVKIVNSLGGKKGMEALVKFAKEQDVPLYFDGINCFAYDSGIFEGFVPFTNAARYTTREQVGFYPYDVVTYLEADWLEDLTYLVKPSYAKENATNMINALGEVGAYGVAFRDIGSLLSADYNPKATVTREQVKSMNISTLEEAQAAGQSVMIRTGNDYAVPYADLITDMDLSGTKYSILDQMVPFYQIALHGLKDYTGAPINLAEDHWQELLKCAESGAGLNFTFMKEDTRILQDTLHSGYYAAHYDAWDEETIEMVTRFQADMEGLNQLRIVGHEQRTETITITTYEDGTKVYVNYGDKSRGVDGVHVPARNYVVKGGDGE